LRHDCLLEASQWIAFWFPACDTVKRRLTGPREEREVSEATEGWTVVGAAADLPDREAVEVAIEGDEVLLYRRGEQLFGISNRCTHQGAQLHEGPIKSFGSIMAVTCPAHGSMFSLNDGRVVRGPAMHPVAAYEVRIRDEQVEVRPVAASGADA
jgi:nitrite reductase/ring-hydroxylating ferredoxin subunit